MSRVAAYVRVSAKRDREGDSYRAPVEQEKAVRQWAADHGHEVVAVYKDEDESGAKWERPGFLAALRDVGLGRVEIVAVNELSRWARSVSNTFRAIELVQQAGGECISVRDPFFGGVDANSKLMTTMMAGIAEWERDIKRDGFERSRSSAVERGIHVARFTPLGYDRDPDSRRLVPNEDAHHVRRIFELRAEEAPWAELGEYLRAHGLRASQGGTTWKPGALQTVIKNRVYLGEARSGQFTNPEAHPPIVDAFLFRQANGVRGHVYSRKGEKLEGVLRGLIRCGGCSMCMKVSSVKARGHTAQKGSYRCHRVHAQQHCPSPSSVLFAVIDPIVEREFLSAFEPGGILYEARVLARDLQEAREAYDAAEAALGAFLSDPDVIDLQTRAPAVYQAGLQARKTNFDERAVSLEHARAQAEVNELTPLNLAEEWPNLAAVEKNRILRAAVDAVLVYRQPDGASRNHSRIEDRLLILWKGQALPLPGRGTGIQPFPYPNPLRARMATSQD